MYANIFIGDMFALYLVGALGWILFILCVVSRAIDDQRARREHKTKMRDALHKKALENTSTKEEREAMTELLNELYSA